MKEISTAPQPEAMLAYLRREHRPMWLLLESAASQGLLVIDEDNDAITATNRLMLTNPILHEVLAAITDRWAEDRCDTRRLFSSLVLGRASR